MARWYKRFQSRMADAQSQMPSQPQASANAFQAWLQSPQANVQIASWQSAFSNQMLNIPAGNFLANLRSMFPNGG